MSDFEKVFKGLDRCYKGCPVPVDCPYKDNHKCCEQELLGDALELLKRQNEVIIDLLHVGYPHNFQREEPWIVRYMYEITEVVKKAVHLNNEIQDSKEKDSP